MRMLPLILLCILAIVSPGHAKPESKQTTTTTLKLGKGDRIVARHTGGTCGVAFSPDGKVLASTGGDAIIRLTDVQTGKEILRCTGHTRFLRRAAFSPDGKLLASGGDDAEIILWDPATGKEVRRIAGHPDGVYRLVFSPDGKTLASGGFDGSIRLRDVATGKELFAQKGHTRVAYAIAFSPDGKVVASGGEGGGIIRFWDTATGKELRHWTAHDEYVYALAFSPNGKLLLSAGKDADARLWEVATAKEVRRFAGLDSSGYSVSFSADGRMILLGSYYRQAHLWELVSGQKIRTFGDHGGNAWVWDTAYSPTMRFVATCGSDETAVLWSLDGMPERKQPAQNLTPKELASLWQDLAGSDPRRAYLAVWALSDSPMPTIAFLREHLQPAMAPKLDDRQVLAWIAGLNSPQYATRVQAYQELDRLGPLADSFLRQALKKAPSLEVRRRLETLVTKLDNMEMPADQLQALRGVQVLETINTADARQILEKLAAGFGAARVTHEAQATLQRLKKRP